MADLLSIPGTFGAGQEFKQRGEFNSLRAAGERQRQDIAQRTFDADQQQANTMKLLNGIRLAQENPSLLPQVGQELVSGGILNAQQLPGLLQRAQTDPDAFRQGLEDLESQLMFALSEAPQQPTFGAPVAGVGEEGPEFRRFAPTGESRAVEGFAPPSGVAAAGAAERFFGSLTADLSAEQQADARLIQLGLQARAGTTSALERRSTDPELGGAVTEQQAREAAAVETAKQAAQIAAIPEKVQTQYRAEFKAEAPKRIRAANDQIARVDSVMEEAQLGLEDIGTTTTGLLGSVNRKIAGTTAFALARKIDTLQANLSFDRIAEMRKNSPTGGALGQVSERELSLLGASVVALDQANNEDEVRRAFTKVLFHYNNWKATITGQRDADTLLTEGDLSGQNNDQLIQQAQQAIQAGADRNAVLQRLNDLGVDTSGL